MNFLSGICLAVGFWFLGVATGIVGMFIDPLIGYDLVYVPTAFVIAGMAIILYAVKVRKP